MKKLLIVVDFQKDFVDGTLGFAKAKTLEDIIDQKIKSYIDEKNDVIFTLDTHEDNYLETLEGKYLPIPHCINGTEGHNLYGKIKKWEINGVKFPKNTYPSLELGNFLKSKNYDIIEICGLVSNICVLSNAIIAKSALPNVEIIIDAKATASYDDNLHTKALEVMEGLHFQIINK